MLRKQAPSAHRREGTPSSEGRTVPQQNAVVCVEVIEMDAGGRRTDGAPARIPEVGGYCL